MLNAWKTAKARMAAEAEAARCAVEEQALLEDASGLPTGDDPATTESVVEVPLVDETTVEEGIRIEAPRPALALEAAVLETASGAQATTTEDSVVVAPVSQDSLPLTHEAIEAIEASSIEDNRAAKSAEEAEETPSQSSATNIVQRDARARHSEPGREGSRWPAGVRVHDDKASVYDLLNRTLKKANPRDCFAKLLRRQPQLQELTVRHVFPGRPKATPIVTAAGWDEIRRHVLQEHPVAPVLTLTEQRDRWAAVAIGLLLLIPTTVEK